MSTVEPPLILGAVAYAPKVVTIWEGFRDWLHTHEFRMEYVLFSHYEAQVDSLLDGSIDIAWHSPLAWIRTRRAALTSGLTPVAGLMRDTDRDLTSVVLVRSDTTLSKASDLAGCSVAVGAYDSPQSRLIPLAHLNGLEVDLDAVRIVGFNQAIGKHGDHIGGERSAVRALLEGKVDAACIISGNQALFTQDGTIGPGSVRVLTETEPYDHCVFTAIAEQGDVEARQRFDELLLSMSFADPAVRPLLELEGLHQWVPGRITGFEQLDHAVDLLGMYDANGTIIETGREP